jgi:hypothetical protein
MFGSKGTVVATGGVVAVTDVAKGVGVAVSTTGVSVAGAAVARTVEVGCSSLLSQATASIATLITAIVNTVTNAFEGNERRSWFDNLLSNITLILLARRCC